LIAGFFVSISLSCLSSDYVVTSSDFWHRVEKKLHGRMSEKMASGFAVGKLREKTFWRRPN
jgi:hypothetical protein